MGWYFAKLLEMIGMVVVLAGLMYGLEHWGSDRAMYGELSLLLVGSMIFLIGRNMEKREGGG